MIDKDLILVASGEPFATGVANYEWCAPSFFGYSGMLDGLRFAIDPDTNRFYFGRRAE